MVGKLYECWNLFVTRSERYVESFFFNTFDKAKTFSDKHKEKHGTNIIQL